MPDLNELGLTDEPIEGVDFDAQPQGSAPIPPQPGIYQFQLPPAEAILKCFDKDDSDADQGRRIVAKFMDSAALRNLTKGDFYRANVSNKTRTINFKSGPVVVSDMAMLLKAVDSMPPGKNNAAYAQALVNAGGKTFMAENRLSVNCSATRDIYKDGDRQEGMKGCGLKYSSSPYTKGGVTVHDIPKDPDTGLYLINFDCRCGASLRVFGNLQGWRKG